MTRLEDLLREDGVKLTRSGKELAACCPFHDEDNPSFSVNPAKQVYYCHGCGAKGGVYQYLVEKRGMAKRDAYEMAGLGDGKPTPKSQPDKPYLWSASKLKANPAYVCAHPYTAPDGKLLFVVIRYDRQKWIDQKPGDKDWKGKFAKCRAYCEVTRNGQTGWIPRHPMKEGRPLYRLPALMKADKSKQVLLVEGEKCVETVRKYLPHVVCTTWPGGGKAWQLTDWEPLRGRKLLIAADADPKGRQTAKKIAQHLSSQFDCKEIKLVLPDGDSTEDVHDWLEQGGVKAFAAKIKKLVTAFEPEKPAELDESEQAQLDDNQFFTILGNLQDTIAVMLSTHRVLTFSRQSLTTPANLIAIADFAWWCNLLRVTTLSPASCHPVGSAMIRIADAKGQIDPTKMIGRGFYRTEQGTYLWHLGDRLLVDGKERDLGDMRKDVVALAGPPISYASIVATEKERVALADAVMAYRWSRPFDGRVFLGWIVASLVGGALPWRPHVWMTGPAETGKTWIMEQVAHKVFGNASVALADATPAAVARRMGSDSLPLLFDEAEPDRQSIEGIMDLIRIAAGGYGERIRAEQSGGVQSFQPRFSAMLSSIKLSQLSDGNASRFVMPEFGPPVEDWPAVQEAIEQAMGIGGARFRAAIMRDAQAIVEDAEKVRRAMGKLGKIGTRAELIYSALSAGWRWWTNGAGGLILPDHKDTLHGVSAEDAPNMLRDILGQRLRTNDGRDISIAQELNDNPGSKIAADYGVRRDGAALLVAASHPSLKQRMDKTRWRAVDPQRMLLQIPGTIKSPNTRNFGPLRHRCVIVPEKVLDTHGIDFTSTTLQDEEAI